MGMYTQLHVGTRLKKDLPEDKVNILKYMIGKTKAEPEIMEAHPLFKASRWHYMLQCDSYYFDYKTTSLFKYDDIGNHWWFNVTCNLKNYENEIALFLDWLYPLIEDSIDEKEFIGYYRYEENDIPNLIYKGNMTQSV